jgi:hypothetical protein
MHTLLDTGTSASSIPVIFDAFHGFDVIGRDMRFVEPWRTLFTYLKRKAA